MKLKIAILFILLFFFTVFEADATQLPKELKDFLISQNKVPTVRFDGIVVYNDNVMYIPIIPAHPKKLDSVKISKTYPTNQTMTQFPDIVVFDNNYSLLKVIRTDKDTLTVKYIPDLPDEVTTGLLPQDIMVPRGLVFPENLSCILGDVHVPLIGSAKSSSFFSRKAAPLPSGKRVAETTKTPLPIQLRNKLFFVNNFQNEFLQIFSPSVTEPLYSLKTSGVMKDIKPVLDGKFILAASAKKKNIDVIDINNEYIAKSIDLTALPTEIAVDDNNKKAYVASSKDESLTVIDLNSMTVKEKIQLAGSPQRLSVSNDGSKIAYLDMRTSGIYVLDLNDDYSNKLISTYPNSSKLILSNNVIYVIARTEPKLRVIYFDLLQDNKITKPKKKSEQEKEQRIREKREAVGVADNLFSVDEDDLEVDELIQNTKMYSTSIKDIPVGQKPVDMYLKNGKVFVLCAGDNSVYTYDVATNDVTASTLGVGGFSKSFTPIPDSNYAVITNMGDLKYVVYDMERQSTVQVQPISEYINMVNILEKSNE